MLNYHLSLVLFIRKPNKDKLWLRKWPSWRRRMNCFYKGEQKPSPSSRLSRRNSLQCKTSRISLPSPLPPLEPPSYAHPETAASTWEELDLILAWAASAVVPATNHTGQETPLPDWARSLSKMLLFSSLPPNGWTITFSVLVRHTLPQGTSNMYSSSNQLQLHLHIHSHHFFL